MSRSAGSAVLVVALVSLGMGVEWNGNNWALNCDFPDKSADFKQIRQPDTGAHCGGTCYATPPCTHFTWLTTNGGTCYLKKGAVRFSDAVDIPGSGACGVIHESAEERQPQPKPDESTGNDIANKMICAFEGKGRATRARLIQHGAALQKVMDKRRFSFSNSQEMAAFLAQVAQETYHLSILEEGCASRNNRYSCPAYYNKCAWYKGGWPPRHGYKYHGRGPLQLTYPCNYKHFSDEFGIDVYNRPTLLTTNLEVAWSAALWTWIAKDPTGHPAIWRQSCSDYTRQGRFGLCIKRINGFEECDGNVRAGREDALSSRVKYYQDIRSRCFALPKERDTAKLYC